MTRQKSPSLPSLCCWHLKISSYILPWGASPWGLGGRGCAFLPENSVFMGVGLTALSSPLLRLQCTDDVNPNKLRLGLGQTGFQSCFVTTGFHNLLCFGTFSFLATERKRWTTSGFQHLTVPTFSDLPEDDGPVYRMKTVSLSICTAWEWTEGGFSGWDWALVTFVHTKSEKVFSIT